ncbi:CapA family protein [Agathobaculum sp. LCP25S3_E8]|uniref:CapA family protein n=1 Tax=Agathobaculum sp. LCP25S3_E8 TaxID=3438735 RepID=UPI003F8DE97E
MKSRLCAAALMFALLTGTCAGAWNEGQNIYMSDWATSEVQAAYDNGAISAAFDLGTDYTRPITRGELARLTVDLVAYEQQLSITDLTAKLGIALQSVPLTPAQSEGESAELNSSSDTSNDYTSNDPTNEVTDSTNQSTDDTQFPATGLTESKLDSLDESVNTGTDSGLESVLDDAADSEPLNDDSSNKAEHAGDVSEESDIPTDNTDASVEGVDEATGTETTPIEPTLEEAEDEITPWGDPLDGGLPYVVSGSFSDTQSVYVEIAARLGIVNGSNGVFRPNEPVSRAEAAAMMQRCMNTLGFSEANRQPQQFSDNYLIPRWAVQAVKYISGRTDETGQPIMGGSSGKFSPLDTYTVEQAILSLRRMQSSLAVAEVADGWREAPGYDNVQLALTFGGDCTLGRGHNFSYNGSFDEMYDRKGASYFFSGISEFFNDDLTMVNFEGTLTTSTSYANKTFVFKGRPEYAKVLDEGSIDVVSVANNHAMDYLQRGFDDTVRYLSPYVAVSGYARMPIVTVKGVRIGFASNVGWSFDNAQKNFIDNAIRDLRQRGAELIVFNYHWGIEKSYHSDATQRAIRHYCIDRGADLVIGHHPHVVQEVEVYKGKPIAYSLGNLVFGGNNNPSDKNCLIFRQNYTFDLNTRRVTASSHQAIPYKISSVSWRNDYRPTKA